MAKLSKNIGAMTFNLDNLMMPILFDASEVVCGGRYAIYSDHGIRVSKREFKKLQKENLDFLRWINA